MADDIQSPLPLFDALENIIYPLNIAPATIEDKNGQCIPKPGIATICSNS